MTREILRTASAGAGSIDWEVVHRRLEALKSTVEQKWVPGADEAKRILRARAERLARPLVDDRAAEEQIELVEFSLASESYAIESSFVREVYPLTDLTPLPCTPGFVLGIVNVRGEIVSVIDVKKFFDLPQKGITDLHKAIILQSERMTFAVVADLIIGVRSIAVREMQPPPPTLVGIREDYLKGVTEDRIVILDAAKLLSDPRMIVHEPVAV